METLMSVLSSVATSAAEALAVVIGMILVIAMGVLPVVEAVDPEAV